MTITVTNDPKHNAVVTKYDKFGIGLWDDNTVMWDDPIFTWDNVSPVVTNDTKHNAIIHN